MSDKSVHSRGGSPIWKHVRRPIRKIKEIVRRPRESADLVSDEAPADERSAAEPVRRGEDIGRLQERKQRTWFGIGLFALLMLVIVANLMGAAVLTGERWTHFSAEVHEIRTWIFFTMGPVVGYYFGRLRD